MSEYDSVKAFAENVAKRTQEQMDLGKTRKEAEDIVSAQLRRDEVVTEHREAHGLVQGFGRMGVQLGGFANYEAIERGTAPDFEAQRLDLYCRNDEGKMEAARIESEIVRLTKGKEHQDVLLELERARAGAIKDGRLDTARAGQIGRGAVGAFSGVDLDQRIINDQTLSGLRERAGMRTEDKYVDGQVAIRAADAGWRSQESVNAEIKELLKTIADNTAKVRKPGEEQPAEKKLGVPIALTVPGGDNKRQ
jgi:hypothetical protein